jgi:hypothetical protein
MKKIKLTVIGSVCLILFGAPVYAQQTNSNLHLPKKFDEELGQMMYSCIEQAFAHTSEYADAKDAVTKEEMDSVVRVALLKCNVSYTFTADSLSDEQSQQILADSTRLKTIMDEIMDAVKKYSDVSSVDLDEMVMQLEAINQKAAANLSEKAAGAIYRIVSMMYYSAKYWSDNAEKWQKLIEDIEKKAKK